MDKNTGEWMGALQRHHDFLNQEVDPDQVARILEAALRTPAVHPDVGLRFVVVDERIDLMKLADAKEHDSTFVAGAALCLVIVGNALRNECWVEDGAAAATAMWLCAQNLRLGGDWVQVRGCRLSDGTSSSEVVAGILDIPDGWEVLGFLALGHPAHEVPMREVDALAWENVCIGKFSGHDG